MAYVNNSPEHRKPLEQVLRDCGIALKSLTVRRQYTVCPKCSSDRKKKKAECLAVTIEADRVHWFCNHCGDKGCEFLEQNQPVKGIYFNYTPTLRKVRLPPKKFFWEHRDGTEWKSGTGGADTKTLLYRIDGCKAAHVADKWILFCEGEGDVEVCWKLGIPATCNAHGAGKWNKGLAEQLTGFKLLLLQDNDTVGIAHADSIEKSVKPLARALIRVDLKNHWPEIPDGGDLRDFVNSGHDLVALCQQLQDAWTATQANGRAALSDDEIAAMAAMSPIELAQKIQQLAAAKGVPQSAVRSEYKAKGIALGVIVKGMKVDEPEAWPDIVDYAALLDEIAKLANKHVVLPAHGDTIVTLYAAYSYLPEIYRVAPRLEITAPQKRCGKTTLLKFLYHICYRRIAASNITPASLFRLINSKHPTLLIDEVNQFAGKDEDFKAVLNDGYDKLFAYVWRCNVNTLDPEPYYCFGPLVYCHTGEMDKDLYDSMTDRSIAIKLSRRTSDEKIEDMDKVGDRDDYLDIRRKLRRFALDNEDRIKEEVRTIDLKGINDRMVDNWRPLLAIAKIAGQNWLERALRAISPPDEEGSRDEMLFDDCKSIRAKTGHDHIYSNGLVERLVDMEDRPWGEMGIPPKPLSTKKLAMILRPYGIKPRYDANRTGRFYLWSDFEPVWKRYTAASTPLSNQSTGFDLNPCSGNGSSPKSNLPESTGITASTGLDPDEWQFNQ